MSTQTLNSISSQELYSQYDWYKKTFPPVVQKGYDDFFLPGFNFAMVCLSKNMNAMIEKDSYFVTKVRLDKDYDMFFRSSEKAVSLILDKVLGKATKTFKLSKMTDLEAKIITSFNDYMYNLIAKLLSPPPVGELKRTNFDIIHMTFIITDAETKKSGKFIVSLPDALLKPETIVSQGEKFDNMTFSSSTLPVKIKIGTTRFSVHELKHLDIEDLVIFDNSNIKKMTLIIDDYEKEINLNPNLGLITPIEDNGGNNMGADNLWDSIEVELNADFDAVKITLGDLKKIEEGNVVDLTSIYDNHVTLRVEDKTIARGQLVIVNDRYGVKVDEILTKQKAAVEKSASEDAQASEDFSEGGDDFLDEDFPQTEAPANGGGQDDDDEFDYSDFELDDEDI